VIGIYDGQHIVLSYNAILTENLKTLV